MRTGRGGYPFRVARDDAERALRAYAEANGISVEEAMRQVLSTRFEVEARERARERLDAGEELDDALDGDEALAESYEAETAEDFEIDLWWSRPPQPGRSTRGSSGPDGDSTPPA